MQNSLYAANYQKRRLEALIRSGGRCENKLVGEDGEERRCPHRLGTFKISRAHNICFEQLFTHHPNNDPENPEAEITAVCASCHMKLHRQPKEPDGKAAPRKQGYQVVSFNQLAIAMRSYGLHMWPTEEGRIHWRIGHLEAEACDQFDAVGMAMHWLSGELRDTLAELEEVRAELAVLQHMVREQECSEVS